MASPQQVATTLVSAAIGILGLALILGGGYLALWGGRVLVGVAGILLGLIVAAGAFFVVLSPIIAQGYDPRRRDDEGDA